MLPNERGTGSPHLRGGGAAELDLHLVHDEAPPVVLMKRVEQRHVVVEVARPGGHWPNEVGAKTFVPPLPPPNPHLGNRKLRDGHRQRGKSRYLEIRVPKKDGTIRGRGLDTGGGWASGGSGNPKKQTFLNLEKSTLI